MKTQQTDYRRAWDKAWEDQREIARAQRDFPEHWESLTSRLALGPYKLMCFGQRLARKAQCTWRNVTVEQAIHLYLVNKHHWHLGDVRRLSLEDLLHILQDEVVSHQMTQEEWEPVHNWTMHQDCYQDLLEASRVS